MSLIEADKDRDIIHFLHILQVFSLKNFLKGKIVWVEKKSHAAMLINVSLGSLLTCSRERCL